MTFQFDATDTRRIRAKLDRLAAEFGKEFDAVGVKWGKSTRARLKSEPYPPKLPNQRYIRTGQLANRWAFRREEPGEWLFDNKANKLGRYYATYVISRQQAEIHQGRWWRAYDVVGRYIPDLLKDIGKEINRILRR
jgi:hypothetical protein